MKRTAVPLPAVLCNRLAHWPIAAIWAFGIALVAMFFIPAQRSFAQDNATITGTISDASGALVPNAAVTLTNPSTGQKRDAVSNSAGAYRFANLGVGTYTLEVAAQGFQKYTRTEIG